MTIERILSEMGNFWRVLSRGEQDIIYFRKITKANVLRTDCRVDRGEAGRHHNTKLSL